MTAQVIYAHRPPEARQVDVVGLATSADLAALVDGTSYILWSGVDGDVAEFGCLAGKSAQAIAAGMARRPEQRRNLWLFDSFQGLPPATDPVDAACPQVLSGEWVWTADIPPAQVRMLCAQYLPLPQIKVVPGWYKDTLKTLPTSVRFAMVHIDCDFYESSLQVLEYLFGHKMFSDGCTLFFDDWYCNRGSPNFGEQRAWAEVTKDGYTFTDFGAYGLMGRRFILHRTDDE